MYNGADESADPLRDLLRYSERLHTESARPTLSAEGNRVQFSVFECDLTDAQFNRLLKNIQGLIDVETDLVTAYPLSAKGRKGQVRLGSLRRDNTGEVVC